MSATDAQLEQLEAMKRAALLPKVAPPTAPMDPKLEAERDAYVAGLRHSD